MTASAERRRPNSLVTSAVTGGALAMQILLSIVVGFVVGRVLGRSEETDGFFAAYAVFMVLSLAANAARLVVLPAFAGARAAGRLAHELMTSFAALAVLLVPATAVVLLAREPLATLLTGGGSAISVDTAADNLVWLVVAGLGQVVAGMLASALAAFDEYVVPAVGYLIASAAGLTLIVLTIHDARTLAIGHGLTLSACLAILVPGVWLVRRVARSPHPVGWRASRPRWAHVAARLKALVTGSTLPFGFQALYLICLPFAGRLEVGSLTTLSYAYMVSGAVVTVGASAIGLVTAVPLARSELSSRQIAHHISSSSWLGLILVAFAMGLTFSLGNELAASLLDPEYGSLGEVTLAMGPFMAVSVVLSITFPVVLVLGREKLLPRIVLAAVVLQVGIAAGGAALAGLTGIAWGLAFSTGLIAAAMLRACGVLRSVSASVARAVMVLACVTAPAFVVPTLLAGPWVGAAVGVVLSVTALVVVRPRPLVDAVHHVRTLS